MKTFYENDNNVGFSHLILFSPSYRSPMPMLEYLKPINPKLFGKREVF